MDVKPAELCIGTTDPAFVGALAAGVAAALALSFALGRLERPVQGRLIPQLYRNCIWFGVLTALFVGTIALLNVLFQWEHPGMTLCTSLIWRWLFAPPTLLFVGGVACGVRVRGRGSDQGVGTPLAK